MLNLRKPSLQIGLTILAFCGLALDVGFSSNTFASTPTSVRYLEIVNSSELTFDTLSINSPTQLAQKNRGRRPQSGSYTQSCKNIKTQSLITRETLLEADCLNKRGQWKNTKLINYHRCKPGTINNANGRLVCQR